MSRVFVLGSMNMDTFLLVDEFVRPGQTIQARAAKKLPGGKGFNQAVAAARMGVDTLMVGSLGADSDGRAMRESASAEHCLDTSRVLEVKAHGTSVAMIQIDNSGENSIVVAPGANQVNDVPSVEARLHDIGPGDVLVCQLEIPVDAVAAGLALACNAGATTILNAAPGMAVGDLLGDVNLLIVNQTEAETILGTQMEGAAQAIHSRYGSNVIVTLGAEGCHVVTVDSSETLPAVAAEVVDTTGAATPLSARSPQPSLRAGRLSKLRSTAPRLPPMRASLRGPRGTRSGVPKLKSLSHSTKRSDHGTTDYRL